MLSYHVIQVRLNQDASRLAQVLASGGLSGPHGIAPLASRKLGGTGGGPNMGGHVLIAGVQSSILCVKDAISCVAYLAVNRARAKASPLARLEFQGGVSCRGERCFWFSLGLLRVRGLEKLLT